MQLLFDYDVPEVKDGLLLFTAIELSLGDSNPYTSTDSCHSVTAILTPVQTVVTR
jgi:hypothetical protein